MLVVLVLVAAHGFPPLPAWAQGTRRVDPSAAELAIAAGRLDLAEDALYEATRLVPREPTARGALGSFLASRGRFLVGATLLEEAMQFGGDTASIEVRLLELYRWAALYDRAAELRTARITPDERESMRRARGTAAGGGPAATVPLQPNEGFGIGRIPIGLGAELVDADVQPLLLGVQLPATTAMYAMVDVVGSHGDTTYAIARSIAIGGVTIGPVPVRVVTGLRTARLGLDLLAQLTPTFDGVGRTLTVHSQPHHAAGRPLPMLLTSPGVSFVAVEGQGPVSLHTPAGRSALRGARWTLDLVRGAIVVER